MAARIAMFTFLALVAVTFSTSCCSRDHESVPFHIISQGNFAPVEGPLYEVIADDETLTKLIQAHPGLESLLEQARSELSTHIFILAIDRIRQTSGHKLSIGSVAHARGSLRVTVVLQAPLSDEIVSPVRSSPFQLIKVPRDRIDTGNYRVDFRADGRRLATRTVVVQSPSRLQSAIRAGWSKLSLPRGLC